MISAVTREHPRFPLRMPVLCESPAVPGYRTVGLTRNVSRGGLLLETPELLAPGSPTSLLLITEGQNARSEGEVVWTAQGIPGRMGLRFTTWTGEDRLIWERLLTFQAGATPRASLRIPIDLEVTCIIPPDTRISGKARNISDGGLMVSLPQALHPRTQVVVAAPTGLSLPLMETETEVMWTRFPSEGNGVLHGLRFTADDISKELFLIGALLQELLDRDEELPGTASSGK
ncbi:MAG: PilZ domain-containing protein [Candidatus Methylomirabilales bacterium]